MSLHILRHKKWHVWNQENEDIYTRDENEYMAKVEAEEKSERMNEMEKRIQMMKERNGLKDIQQTPIADPSNTNNNAVHLESNIKEKGEISYGDNEEYKSEEYEKKLKDIQSLRVPIWKLKPTERPAEPWYAEDLSVKRNQYGKRLNEDEVEKQERRDKVLKEMEDPLRKLRKQQEQREKDDSIVSQMLLGSATNPDELKASMKTRMLNQPSDIQAPKKSHSIKEESRSHRHHHHHKHHSSKTNAVVSSIEESEVYQQKRRKELEIQKLREERIKRETEERKRSNDLLLRQMKRM